MINRDILKQVGLTSNETEVYLTLLKLGEATIYQVSNHCQISRPNLYDIMNGLVDRGLTTSIIKSNKSYYKPVAPKKLMDILKEKQDNLMMVLPDLNNLYTSTRLNPQVEVYQGAEGLKTILNDMVKVKKDIWIFNGVDLDYASNQISKEFIQKILREKKKFKIKTYLLYSEGINPPKGAGYKLKKISDENLGCVGYWTYGDRVTIGIWTDPLIIVRITSEEVARVYRKSMELLWK